MTHTPAAPVDPQPIGPLVVRRAPKPALVEESVESVPETRELSGVS